MFVSDERFEPVDVKSGDAASGDIVVTAYRRLPSWFSLDTVHYALDAASFAPSFIGSGASAIDAGVYAFQGDRTGAGIALAAAGVGLVSDAGAVKVGLRAARYAARLGKYEVGAVNILKKSAEAGLEPHHVGQGAIMRKLVSGYHYGTAPAILVPKQGHTFRGVGETVLSRNTKGITSVRSLVARDIRELRRAYPDVPNSSLQKLIDLNKSAYPTYFVKAN